MEKLSLNKEKKIIEEVKNKIKTRIEDTFYKKDSIGELVKKELKIIEFYQKYGLDIDIDKINNGIHEAIKIEDKNLYVSYVLELLDPLIIFMATQPELVEKAEREFIMSNYDNTGRIRLSECMYCGINEKNRNIHIHLAPSKDFINKDNLKNFYLDIENGFKKLAEIVRDDERIQKITATSWIVAKSEDRMKDLGFTIEGAISDDVKNRYFKKETRPISSAFINREDFLKRYGN